MKQKNSRELKFSDRFGKPERYIGPGEFYTSTDDIVISTLLGSCISVALYDTELQMGGMNHFMLPIPNNPDNSLLANRAKYGIHAMEELINDILKQGGKKSRLKAKVFGGSTVLRYEKASVYDIPKLNINFILEFLATENLPITAFSVGGTLPRKLFFFPKTFKVLMKCSPLDASGLVRQENHYAHELLEKTNNYGNTIIY